VAASSIADSTVLACLSSVAANVTAEGYPGARFHAGCEHVDEIEELAIHRAKTVFNAGFANVQPHSASTANQIVMFSLLRPGDTILGMDLAAGGHLTHGSPVSVSGRYFKAIAYGLDERGFLDYDQVRELARRHRPKLIICGTTAYPRTINFSRFRQIADDIGAYLLADMTHIAGLVAAGLHPSPIDHAHFTTTCTHKQLYGPRGGLILMGRDHDGSLPGSSRPLSSLIQRGVFPLCQGAPIMNVIAGKARALAMVAAPEFKLLARRIVDQAKALARCLQAHGKVVSGGTDTHIVLLDVLSSYGLTGVIAEKALEECNIIVNRNKIPGDTKPPVVTSGIRLGTNSLASRRLNADDVAECARLIDAVLGSLVTTDDHHYELRRELKQTVIEEVERICARNPLPYY